MKENQVEEKEKEEKERQEYFDRAREALLDYFGSQIRTHATNILAIFLGIMSSFQIYTIHRAAHTVVFSVLITALIWQSFRLLYYSYLSSNVIIAKPFPKNHERFKEYEKSEDYEITPLKQLYTKIEYIMKEDKRLGVSLIRFFGNLRLKVLVFLGVLTLCNFFITSLILNKELIKPLLEALCQILLQ